MSGCRRVEKSSIPVTCSVPALLRQYCEQETAQQNVNCSGKRFRAVLNAFKHPDYTFARKMITGRKFRRTEVSTLRKCLTTQILTLLPL